MAERAVERRRGRGIRASAAGVPLVRSSSAFFLVGAFLVGATAGSAAPPPKVAAAVPSLELAGPTPKSIFEDGPWLTRLESALERVYNLELDDAADALGELVEARADHPVAPLLAALPTWWRILLDPESTSFDASMSTAVETALARADARLRGDPQDRDGRFFKATALAFRSRLRSLRQEWVRSALDGRKALDLVRDLEAEGDDPDLAFGLGLYDYFADVVPDRYPVLRPLAAAFPPGDRQRGLGLLERAMTEGRFARSEAAYYLLMIRHHFEHDPAGALVVVGWLRSRYPSNSLFHLYQARILVREGRCEEAQPVLDEVLTRHAGGREGYLDPQAAHALLLGGRCHLVRGRYAEALRQVDRVRVLLAGRPGSALGAQAMLAAAMAHDALGHRPAALGLYKRILELPDAAGSHRAARRFLREPYGPGRPTTG